jgi:hypothetical protein
MTSEATKYLTRAMKLKTFWLRYIYFVYPE